MKIETIDELLEILDGVASDVDAAALGWALPPIAELLAKLRQLEAERASN